MGGEWEERASEHSTAATQLGAETALELGAGRAFHSAEMPEI